jgi:hypothetical protein
VHVDESRRHCLPGAIEAHRRVMLRAVTDSHDAITRERYISDKRRTAGAVHDEPTMKDDVEHGTLFVARSRLGL